MRASLFDLHAVYEATIALSGLYDERGPTYRALDAFAARIWRTILNRPLANESDARVALWVVREMVEEEDGRLSAQGPSLLHNLQTWLGDQDRSPA